MPAQPHPEDENAHFVPVPRDGSMPFDGAFPTLIEWPVGPHPWSSTAGFGCELEKLSIEHPEGGRLSHVLDPLFTDDRIAISTGNSIHIRATIKTSSGHRELI